jgi:hypothetical protein
VLSEQVRLGKFRLGQVLLSNLTLFQVKLGRKCLESALRA